MRTASFSINQVIEMARDMKNMQNRLLYVPEVNQLVLVIKENTEKVKQLKQNETYVLDVRYMEEYEALFIALRFHERASEDDVGALVSITQEMYESFDKVANSYSTLEVYTIGDDLETISARHIFSSDVSKFMLSEQLKKVPENLLKN